jgi:hypothetical protein
MLSGPVLLAWDTQALQARLQTALVAK